MEALWQTSCIEGEEELGLESKHINHMYDFGTLIYKDYGIRFFAVLINKNVSLINAIDSHEVRWMTIDDVNAAITTKEFNARYMPLLTAMNSTLTDTS